MEETPIEHHTGGFGIRPIANLKADVKKTRQKTVPAAKPEVLKRLWDNRGDSPYSTGSLFHTCYTAICSTKASYAESWNMQFQDLLDMECPDVEALTTKKAQVLKLHSDFLESTRPTAIQIVKELSMDDSHRSIPSAGLSEPIYKKNSAVFQVWPSIPDAKRLVRSLETVTSCRVRGLTAPLVAIFIYRGHPVTITACIKVKHTGDGSLSMEPTEAEKKLLRRLCKEANVSSDTLDDTHITHSKDGRLYLTDVESLVPLCNVLGSVTVRLRPEMIQRFGEVAVKDLGELTEFTSEMQNVYKQCLQQAVDVWLQGELSCDTLVATLHAHGVNLAMLGQVMSLVKDNIPALRVAMTEVVARVCTTLLRVEMRSTKSRDIDVFLISASRMLGAVLADTHQYWEALLNPISEELYPCEERVPLTLASVDKQTLFRRICRLSYLVFKNGSVVDLKEKKHVRLTAISPVQQLVLEGNFEAAKNWLHNQTTFDQKLHAGEVLNTMGQTDPAREILTQTLPVGGIRQDKIELVEVLLKLVTVVKGDERSQRLSEVEAALRGEGSIFAKALLRNCIVWKLKHLFEDGANEEKLEEARSLVRQASEQCHLLDEQVALKQFVDPILLYATALLRHGDKSGALKRFKQIRDCHARAHVSPHPDTAYFTCEVGSIEAQQGYAVAAERSFRNAVQLMSNAMGPKHVATADMMAKLSEFYVSADDKEKLPLAVKLSTEAVAIVKAAMPSHIKVCMMLQNLAYLHSLKLDYSTAEELTVEAIHLAVSLLGTTHPDVVRLKKFLVSLRIKRRTNALAVINKSCRAFLWRLREIRRQRKRNKNAESPKTLETKSRDENVASGEANDNTEPEVNQTKADNEAKEEEEQKTEPEPEQKTEAETAAREEEEQKSKLEKERNAEFKSKAKEEEERKLRAEEKEKEDAVLKEKNAEEKTMEEAKAATKIQSLQRGKAARKDVALKKQNIALEKQEAETRQTQKEQDSATKIQALQRGRHARKEVDVKRQELDARKAEEAKSQQKAKEDAAATKIQSLQRGKQARKEVSQKAAAKEAEQQQREADQKARGDTAATKIQSMQRGKQARKEVSRKRNEQAATIKAEQLRQEEENCAAAATKIQSMQRGRQARKKVAGMKKDKEETAAEEAKRKEEAEKAAEKKREEAARQENEAGEEEQSAATKIQSLQRGREARKEFAAKKEEAARKQAQQENQAAIKIQSAQRGRQARNVAAQKRSDKAAANAEANQLQKEKECSAATKLQSLQRGRQARKEVSQKKSNMTAAENAKKQQQKEEEEEQIKAATKIQSLQRGRHARKEVTGMKQAETDTENAKKAERSAEEDRAATKIQSLQRGKIARKEVGKKKDLAAADKRAADEAKTAKEEEQKTREAQAATKIQSMQRGQKTRRELSQKKTAAAEEEVKRQKHEDAAATKIQSLQRGKQARKEASQKAAAKEAERQQREADQRANEAAATKIQSMQRGRQARKEVEKLKQSKAERAEPSASVKTGEGEEEGTDEVAEEKAATKIQSLQRGRQARRKVAQKKNEMAAATMQANETDTKAATKIQSLQRGRLARKEASIKKSEKEASQKQRADEQKEKESSAATKIQSLQRGKQARKEASIKKSEKEASQQRADEQKTKESSAATKIQSLQRGKQARKEASTKKQAIAKQNEKENKAAAQIQALQRGKQARKEATQRKEDKKARDMAKGKVNEESAATKIQSLQRGRHARKEAATKAALRKTEKQLEQQEKASETMALEKKNQDEAALKIQAMQRGRAAKKEANNRRTLREMDEKNSATAATKIQSVHRGRQARKQAEGMRNKMEGAQYHDDDEYITEGDKASRKLARQRQAAPLEKRKARRAQDTARKPRKKDIISEALEVEEYQERRLVKQDTMHALRQILKQRALEQCGISLVELQRNEYAHRAHRTRVEKEEQNTLRHLFIRETNVVLAQCLRKVVRHEDVLRAQWVKQQTQEFVGLTQRVKKQHWLLMLSSRIAAVQAGQERSYAVIGEAQEREAILDEELHAWSWVAEGTKSGLTDGLQLDELRGRNSLFSVWSRMHFGIRWKEIEGFKKFVVGKRLSPSPPAETSTLSPTKRGRGALQSSPLNKKLKKRKKNRSPSPLELEAVTRPECFELTQPRFGVTLMETDDKLPLDHLNQYEAQALQFHRMLLRNQKLLHKRRDPENQEAHVPVHPAHPSQGTTRPMGKALMRTREQGWDGKFGNGYDERESMANTTQSKTQRQRKQIKDGPLCKLGVYTLHRPVPAYRVKPNATY